VTDRDRPTPRAGLPDPARDPVAAKALLDELMRATPLVAIGSFIGSLFVGLQFLDDSGSPGTLAWLLASAAIALARVGYALAYNRWFRVWPGLRLRRWVRVAHALMITNAALWGLASVVHLQQGDQTAEVLLHVVLCAIAMGATQHLAGYYGLLRAFVLMTLVPLVLRDLWIGDPGHLVLAVLCSIVLMYSLAISANHAKAIAELFMQRRRNAELIEALRRENQATDAARRLAEEANAARTRLFAAANHDLRQPLQAIGLLAQSLKQTSTEVPVRQNAERIQVCVDSLGDLVDGMLELAQFDASVLQPRLQAFALDSLLDEALGAHRPLAENKGLDLQCGPANAWVVSDRRMVLRLLNNLLSNAIRYTPAGSVTVRVLPAGARLQVLVEDTGIGIADDQHARIFEDFYQVANPARDRRQGLGLGLATARRISDLLGLELSVASRLGESSAFSFWLPLAPAGTAVPTACSEPAGTLPAPAGRRLLVVEDDAASLQALAELLTAWGCDVRTAEDAEAAWRIVEQGFAPDLLLSDLRLGDGADGLALIARLQTGSAHPLPAVLITGDGLLNEVRSTPHGQVTVLRKPVKPAQLRALLNQAFLDNGLATEQPP
jgi:signal transduction histidine kinase/CheY-like chemotaxis protein